MATLRHYSAPSPAMDHFQSIPRQQRAEPFLKWAGGKKRFIPLYDSLLPSHFETYHEPFLGGGSVFLYLSHTNRIQRALLSDINAELIHLYRVIRDQVDALIAELQTYPYESAFYYQIRALDPLKISPLQRAARMLYLNRTCFNGLYRVNRQGKFNVPIGRYENPVICNTQNLRNVERALTGVELQCWSFETALEFARPGDFFYLDPPTVSPSPESKDGLTEKEQGRLYEIVRILDRRGCLVMLSNLNTPFTKDLFSQFDQRELRDPRSAGRRSRGRKTELVIRNYA